MQPKAMAIALSMARRSKAKKMAKGGKVMSSDMHMSPISSDEGVKAIMKKRMMMAQGGQLPEDMDYLALNDSYPDPEDREFDMLDPNQPDLMFDGGEVEEVEQDSDTGMMSEMKMKRKKMLDSIFASMSKDDDY